MSAALKTQSAEAFHFCGHIYTTGSCPHPTGLPRIDAFGFPLRARDGKPVDDLGRPVDSADRPIDARGNLLLDPDGVPLPPASRTRICQAAGRQFRFKHAKGTAEWLKNSLDQYLRLREGGLEPRSGAWPVVIDLIDKKDAA